MTDLLSIGASGLRSYRAALGVTGDNVANAQTHGYARRSVAIAEVRLGNGPNPLYRARASFDGSEPASVTRAADMFRTSDARIAAADHARANATARWLATAETALGDRIGGTLATMFANGDRLAADPNGTQPRIGFLAGLEAAASEIRTSAFDLARVAASIGDSAANEVAAANAELGELAAVNLAIRRQQQGTTAFAELCDQRDQLADALADRFGATTIINGDGTATLDVGTTTILQRGTAATLTLTRAADGRLSFATQSGACTPTAGTLSGLASAADSVADRRAELDILATGLIAALNAWHTGGLKPDGSAGSNLLAGTGAADLTVLVTAASEVAAGSSTAGNGNALALASVRSSSGAEAAAALIVAQQASATRSARDAETLTGRRSDTAAAARDAVEGVDLDREAADLLRYQQAYQGAARVIQVARETVDTILALFR